MPYLFANKIAIFQPPYSTILLMEDPWPNCIIFFLYSAALFRNFIFLPNSPFICGPTPLYRPIPKII